jgi:hypothetical protein
MSIIGILSSNLFSAGAAQNTQSTQNTPSAFQQIKTEFQQLGQDLVAGDLKQAQSDFTTLAQSLSAGSQSGATTANPASGGNTIAQAFAQLGQDLQAGNLQAAQKTSLTFSRMRSRALLNRSEDITAAITTAQKARAHPPLRPSSGIQSFRLSRQ